MALIIVSAKAQLEASSHHEAMAEIKAMDYQHNIQQPRQGDKIRAQGNRIWFLGSVLPIKGRINKNSKKSHTIHLNQTSSKKLFAMLTIAGYNITNTGKKEEHR